MKLSLSLFALVASKGVDHSKCPAIAEVENGLVKCKRDTCMLKCNEGFAVNGSGKTKCLKDEAGVFGFNKELGTCDPCPAEGCDAMEEEKPDKPTGDKPTGDKPTGDKPTGDKPEIADGAIIGDEGKWTKCPAPASIENGFIKCKKDQCAIKCAEGFMVDGEARAKCEKLDDDTFAFNVELGSCTACGDNGCEEPDDKPDKPTGDKPTKPTKPDGEEKPPVFGDDGKWTKCPAPAAVENGNVKCKKDTCMLKCAEGFVLNGSGKTKCIKNDDETFSFNKELGACDACPDGDCEGIEPTKPEKPTKPTGDKPAAGECKDFAAILGDDSIFAVECSGLANKDTCAVTCPQGSFFMGKDGKEGTTVSCKCKGTKCKWANIKGKTINGKEVAKWACE